MNRASLSRELTQQLMVASDPSVCRKLLKDLYEAREAQNQIVSWQPGDPR